MKDNTIQIIQELSEESGRLSLLQPMGSTQEAYWKGASSILRLVLENVIKKDVSNERFLHQTE